MFVSAIGIVPFISPLFRLGDHAYFIKFSATMVAAAWTVTLVIIVCLRLSGAGASAIGLQPPLPMILLLVASGCHVIRRGDNSDPGSHLIMKQPSLPTLPWTHPERYFMLLVVAPTAADCQETIYRGLLLRFLKTPSGLSPAMAAQAVVFAYMHGGLSKPLFLSVNVTILGFLLGLFFPWRRTLRARGASSLRDATQITMVLTKIGLRAALESQSREHDDHRTLHRPFSIRGGCRIGIMTFVGIEKSWTLFGHFGGCSEGKYRIST